MPWLSVLSNGTCRQHTLLHRNQREDFFDLYINSIKVGGDTGERSLVGLWDTNNWYIVVFVRKEIATLRMKQNSELRLLESVPIWIVLREKKKIVSLNWPGLGVCVNLIIGDNRTMSTWCKVRCHWCVCGRGRAEQSQSSVSSSLCGWWTSSWNGRGTWGSPAAGSYAPPKQQERLWLAFYAQSLNFSATLSKNA